MGEYDLPTFRERMAAVRQKIEKLEKREADACRAANDARLADPAAMVQKLQAVLDTYWTSDAAGRNSLLRSVIDQITYHKEKKTKPADFYLDIQLKPY